MKLSTEQTKISPLNIQSQQMEKTESFPRWNRLVAQALSDRRKSPQQAERGVADGKDKRK